MQTRKWWERPQSLALASLVIVVSFGVLGWFNYVQRQIDYTNQRVERQLKHTNQQLSAVKQQTHDQLVKDGLTSADDKTRQSADQMVASDQLNLACSNLFKVLLTYDSQQSWLVRADKLRDQVTPEILHDRKFFNDGRDDSGQSIIEALQLRSEFDSLTVDSGLKQGNDIAGLVHVQYTANSAKAPGGVRTKVYLVHYDLAQKRFTQLEALGTEALQPANKE